MIPPNLLFIVVVQAAACLAVHVIVNTSTARSPGYWLASLGCGVALGLVMDKVLGAYRLFAYLPEGMAGPPVEPGMLALTTLVFNGAFSYGIAIATAGVLMDGERRVGVALRWIVVPGAVVALGIAGILLLPSGTFRMMFAWGAVVLGVGEMILQISGGGGPFVAFLSGTTGQPLARLWIFSIAIGAVYETANWIAPFWVWLPDAGHSRPWTSVTVVVLGYVVLFHPIMVFWTLIRRGATVLF
ncbi:MAG TPA: hypothetical protein VLV86_20580 [Vicinamibacterales bacterium]|nr:hypothetical protein [Vicinamibacterales bacterium]